MMAQERIHRWRWNAGNKHVELLTHDYRYQQYWCAHPSCHLSLAQRGIAQAFPNSFASDS